MNASVERAASVATPASVERVQKCVLNSEISFSKKSVNSPHSPLRFFVGRLRLG